jgi:hypothetical protein
MLPDGPDLAEAFAGVIQQGAVPLPGLPTHRRVPNRPQPRGINSMGRRNDGSMPRYQSKRARKLARAVISAGGIVELTANGHMRITGPDGVAIVGAHTTSWRAEKNAVATIRKHAGLEIRL